ncbi:dTDP-4-dehydrorhamnose reductase [Ectothiorhodospira haloalkaliphila]|uniref:dTDP-4-dehydrorhamnose reductase n=1 Tax=Ectothiorhodospira haloalkaliphila TaxID=421628 RepID=W8KW34_9GAMM|nr:dTDP-4-dehydrorhamnose reductase [Ectothiorhodospira haloalkaliphila]AHK79771.1 dTDP-4-dehydrorhamnose reductase [Ectothiorhodospira haloalkaliphila]
MNILILGATGQVGFELLRALSPLGSLIAPTRAQLDLSSPDAVAGVLRAARPALIVNAAAWTAVDAAEAQREAAFRLNAELPAQLACFAAIAGIPVIHYSSDYVYPGDGDAPWREDSPTGPLSVYGQSKLAGDEAVMASGAEHLIFRTSWVYSARGSNFMKTMLRLGQERDSLKVVNDQIGAPTPARLIAEVTALAVYRQRLGRGIEGLYHLAPHGETSWHGFACEIFRRAAESGMALKLTPAQVAAIPGSDYPTPAQRPGNSRLCVDKLEADLGIDLPHWEPQLVLTLGECFA